MSNTPLPLSKIGDQYISACVYGGPGVGKTTLACSSSKYNTFLFDIDDGTASLRANPNLDPSRVWIQRCYTYTDFMNGLAWLEKNINSFQVIVVDTATELQRIILAEIKDRNKTKDQRQNWGETLEVMEAVTRSFKQFRAHRIFTAHEMEFENPDTRRMVYKAAFQGQYGQNSMYSKHFDEVWRYFLIDVAGKDQAGQTVYQTQRWLNCQRDMTTYGKDRLSCLEKYEPPVFDHLFAKLENALLRQTTENTNA